MCVRTEVSLKANRTIAQSGLWNTLDHDICDRRAHYEDRIGRPDHTDGMIMLYAVRPNSVYA